MLVQVLCYCKHVLSKKYIAITNVNTSRVELKSRFTLPRKTLLKFINTIGVTVAFGLGTEQYVHIHIRTGNLWNVNPLASESAIWRSYE